MVAATASATLPVDVLLDVVDACYLSPTYIPDYRTLRTLSLVCPQLTPHAQALLFRNVFLWRDTLACALGAALNPATEKGRWLAHRVRVLRAIVRPAGSREGHGLSQRAFLAVVRACPDLREIDMDPRRGFEPYLFATMRAHPPPVEVLRFHITDVQHFLIIGLFPRLKYLHVKDAGRHMVPLGTRPPSCALRELHWRGDTSAAEWILRGSLGAIEILTLDAPVTCSSAFRVILETHGPSLRSLSVRDFGEEMIPLLRNFCTRLEEFAFNALPTAALLAALPSTLEHLQFSGSARCGKLEKQELLNFIRLAPSLLNITYCLGHWADDPLVLRWLAKVCARNLIVFFHFAPPFGSFPGERLEFGPVSSFPRPLSLSPLRLRESNFDLHSPERTSVPDPEP